MKILIVDDLELNRKLLRVILQTDGMETLEAEDGAAALEVMKGALPDAIISDILMPNMDGYRLCKEIRANPRWAKIPVVIYTSTYVSAGEAELALKCGADKYMKKPSPSDEIITAIRGLVASGRIEKPVYDKSFGEAVILKQYSEVLVQKLEKRNLELYELTDQLTQSEEKFRQLVENINQIFFLVGPGGVPGIYISPSYEKVFGRTCASFYENPLSWLDCVVPEDRSRVEELVRTHLGGFEVEYRLSTATRAVRWIRARYFPVVDKAGKAIRLGGVAEDITPFKQAEAQLRHAQKMDGIGRLAGGIAHDFNNILTAITGYSYFLLTTLAADDPQRADVVEIQNAAERAASLTRQLLAFSRQQVLQPKVVDLNALVQETEKMLRRLIGENMNLAALLAPDAGRITADPGQIAQVLLNLVVNARDAMPQGGKITIETANVELGDDHARKHPDARLGPHVLLAVSDTGCGMDPEILSHLFEPFFTTKEAGKGTGLGLATVYGIVKQSSGSISVESEPGHGSTFKIHFPRVQEAVEALPAAAALAGPTRGCETILLVEDDEAVRKFVHRLLDQIGYTVLQARNPKEAIQIFDGRKEPIHLLLTDIVMPGMRGDELANHLSPLWPHMKVVFISGYTEAGVVRRDLLNSDTAFIQKPVDPAILTGKVREMLDTL
jgi:two-component system cell cycle sensor histidine kinase/response regulator CckA